MNSGAVPMKSGSRAGFGVQMISTMPTMIEPSPIVTMKIEIALSPSIRPDHRALDHGAPYLTSIRASRIETQIGRL